jgi:hypothetical protein
MVGVSWCPVSVQVSSLPCICYNSHAVLPLESSQAQQLLLFLPEMVCVVNPRPVPAL